MKRHLSLHPLSEHHHHALVQALLIARAVYPESRKAGRRAGKSLRRRATVRRVARDYLHFWHTTGQQHFRDEEEVLLPALAGQVSLEDEPAVLRMLAQHARIRARVEELARNLAARRDVEAELIALGQMLHDHVRLEENEVFPRIEAVLEEKELRRLGERLTPLHGTQRPRQAPRPPSRKKRTTAVRKR